MKYLQKISDFLKGKKNISEITKTGKWKIHRNYMYEISTGNIIKSTTNILNLLASRLDGLVDWKRTNPDYIPIYGLNYYESDKKNIIDIHLVLSDLQNLCINKKLQIVQVEIESSFNREAFSKDGAIMVTLQEIDYEEGDGIPKDMLSYYTEYIQLGLIKKRNYYYKNYNFPSLRKTKNNFYSVSNTELRNSEKKTGTFTLKIVTRF